MVIKHYLNGTEIDEPIGFDNLKMTMKRGDYHGMSAEVSELSLEFYGTAADIVRAAYQADLDTEVTYRVTTDDEEMYSGVLDLSTYEEQCSEYCSVSCKVGEIGVKTTFNNRTDTDIDLNTTKTIDGLSLAHTYPWHNLTLPNRTINFINSADQSKDVTYSEIPDTQTALQLSVGEKNFMPVNVINIALNRQLKNEFGTFTPTMYAAKPTSGYNLDKGTVPNVNGYFEPFFNSDSSTQDDNDSIIHIELDIKLSLKFTSDIYSKDMLNNCSTPYLYVYPCIITNSINGEIVGIKQTIANDNIAASEFHFQYSKDVTAADLGNLYVALFIENKAVYQNIREVALPATFDLAITKGSYMKMTYISKALNKVSADMMLLHEAMNKVSEVISENALTVKSDLYSRSDSVINKHTADSSASTFEREQGLGALRALTNGYKIRGLYTDSDNERSMPMSFKTLIESLDALDCIGWGFSTESGTTYIRVERWSWFYQTGDPILVINNPNSVKTSIDTSLIISELTIGYKKYLTNEDIASIDNIMSERTFTTSTKAISNSVTKQCEFIADNYAAELTRRAAIEKEADEEFQYDENIFIFSLKRSAQKHESIASTDGTTTTATTSTAEVYSIPPDINTADSSVLNSTEVYNAKISPARNAYRWIDRLFCVAGLQPFTCTSGKVNYKAQITTTPQPDLNLVYITPDPVNDIPTYTVLDPSGSQIASGIKQNAENLTLRERYFTKYKIQASKPMAGVKSDDDLIIPRIFRAETIEFTYPLSVAEYKKVKANPYGLIEVDGVLGWIKEFSYSFSDGEATFKLIPKAD